MKVFISCDIEGTNGIAAWEETDKPKAAYPYYAQKMTAEVAAACKGINCHKKVGEIFIKDAHDSARNLDHSQLPRNAVLNRGWSGTPYVMVHGIDPTFDAALFTGYHSGGGYNGSPLAHTMSNSLLSQVRINGKIASEFLINYYACLYNKVPVVLVTGDAALCQTVKEIDPAIHTVATHQGLGGSVTAPHPQLILDRIEAEAELAVAGRAGMSLALPSHFSVEISFKNHAMAHRGAYYPGAVQVDAHTVGFEADDYFEVLRFILLVY